MLQKVLSLSKQLITLPSTSDNKEALETCLGLTLSHLKGFTIEKFEKDGVQSVLVYAGKKRPKKFKLLLNAHLDIIPGKDFQYVPNIVGNKLYGTGALDMKANLACFVMVFAELAKQVNYPLGLQITTDEEIGGFSGTKHQVDKGVRADFVIAGETTNFGIAHKAKGIIWLKITTIGKTGHGAYPWVGDNAIWKMNDFLTRLKKVYPVPSEKAWVTTINVSKIETTNSALNKIPDDCSMWLDIRYIPEDKNTVLKKIKQLLGKDFSLEIIANEPAINVDEDNAYIQLLKTESEAVLKKEVVLYGAQGSSDVRHFTGVNCEGIEFGPIGQGIGSDNEWIDIKSLEKYMQILTNFILALNTQKV